MKKLLFTLLISALAIVAQAQCVIDGTTYIGSGTKTTTAKACAVKTGSLDTNTPTNLNIGVDSATSVYVGHGIANSRTGSYLSMGSSGNTIGYYNLGSSADSKLNFGIGNFTFTGGGSTILTGSNSLLSTPRNFECQSFGYVKIAKGTTTQEGSISADDAMVRFNTTLGKYRGYFNTGSTWDNIVFEAQSQILTNKTLMSPVITDNSAVNAITPSNRQLLYNDGFSPTVALDWGDISKGLGINSLSSPKYAYFKTDLLTGNKTFFFPNISGSYDTVITATSTNLLTNKKISGSTNTITNIGNSALINHTITINGDPVDLGGSVTVTADLPNALTSGAGLQFNTGTTFDGSVAKTISVDATVATLSGSQVLTNKTLSGSSNTFSNIGNSSLSNSTISGVSLGSNLFSITPGTGLLGSSYNGSATVPWRINKSALDTINTNTVGGVTGNAGTATTLQNTRRINAVQFNGSADINTPGLILYDNFHRANTSVNSLGTAPTGQTYQLSGSTGQILNNAFYAPEGTTVYAYANLNTTISRIGFKVSFTTGTGGTGQTAAFALTPDSSINNLSVHFYTSNLGWTLQTRTGGGAFIIIGSGTYPVALRTDATPYNFEVNVTDTTAYINAAGYRYTATSLVLRTLKGKYAYWEHFYSVPTALTISKIHEVYAGVYNEDPLQDYMRISGFDTITGTKVFGADILPKTNNIYKLGSGSTYWSTIYSVNANLGIINLFQDFLFKISSTASVGKIWNSTGNWTFQNGGSFTDNGYRVEITGTSKSSTSHETPLLIGGTGATSALEFRSTSGTGTSTALGHKFSGGTAGANDSLMSVYNDGQILIGGKTRNPGSLGLLRIRQGTGNVDIGQLSSGVGAVWISQTTPTTGNYAISSTSSNTTINTPSPAGTFTVGTGAVANRFQVSGVNSSLAFTGFTFTPANNTNQTASANISGYRFNAVTRQWATGNITTQDEANFAPPVYNFVGASTITTASTVRIGRPPIAGTNATITLGLSLKVIGNTALGSNLYVGDTATAPTARIHIIGGTASTGTAPLKFTSGTNLTTTEAGAVEYDGTHLYFSAANSGPRYTLDRQTIGGSVSATGTATTTFTVTIGATQANATYKVTATPSNVLSAALFYINNKTTTTFDVVYTAGLTGAVAFDWILVP